MVLPVGGKSLVFLVAASQLPKLLSAQECFDVEIQTSSPVIKPRTNYF